MVMLDILTVIPCQEDLSLSLPKSSSVQKVLDLPVPTNERPILILDLFQSLVLKARLGLDPRRSVPVCVLDPSVQIIGICEPGRGG